MDVYQPPLAPPPPDRPPPKLLLELDDPPDEELELLAPANIQPSLSVRLPRMAFCQSGRRPSDTL